ncbi:MAG: hypothetical protein JNL01_11600 [Bdellovibrionales bacterium]|nr:hypothetical protein [Bdellovibrionales bacterium]
MEQGSQSPANVNLSETETLEGHLLVETLLNSTGLPSQLVSSELEALLEGTGHSKESLTLDRLRQVMLQYLESTHESLQEDSLIPSGSVDSESLDATEFVLNSVVPDAVAESPRSPHEIPHALPIV